MLILQNKARISSAIIALAICSAVYAQADDDNTLQAVIVTAQRTSEDLQKVPIAVSVISGNDLISHGLTSTLDLQAVVPSLSLSGQGLQTNFYLRGVGQSAGNVNNEQSVAMYVDGVYIASPTTSTMEFDDIKQIEVLKGPQGTLFGRNATGGVILITTQDPVQQFGGTTEVGYANFDTISAKTYITGGITSDLAANFSVSYDDQGTGWGHNLALNSEIYKQDDLALRSKFLFTPNEGTSIRASFDYAEVKSAGLSPQPKPDSLSIGGGPDPGPYNTYSNFRSALDYKTGGAAVNVDQELSFAQLVSISAFRKLTGDYSQDQDGSPAPLVNAGPFDYRNEQFSQELQLLSTKRSALKWLAGIYFIDSSAGDPLVHLTGAVADPFTFLNLSASSSDVSYSLYGQASLDVGANTRVTAGARYTDERQKITQFLSADPGPLEGPLDQEQRFRRPTWRLSLDHDFSDKVMGYASYNRGLKSGGYSLLAVEGPAYKPETLDAYETGVKTDLFDNHLRVNAAAFHYEYTNIQVQSSPEPGVNLTTNAAKAKINGLDLDIDLIPIKDVKLTAAVGYLHGRYARYPDAVSFGALGNTFVFDATGKNTINSPPVTATLAADYIARTALGNITLDSSLTYYGGAYQSPDNRLYFNPYTLLNASVTWAPPESRYEVRFWGKNLTDKLYIAFQNEQAGLGDVETFAAPRTYGVTIRAHF